MLWVEAPPADLCGDVAAELEQHGQEALEEVPLIGGHGPRRDTWTVPAVLPILVWAGGDGAHVRVPPRHAGRGALWRYDR